MQIVSTDRRTKASPLVAIRRYGFIAVAVAAAACGASTPAPGGGQGVSNAAGGAGTSGAANCAASAACPAPAELPVCEPGAVVIPLSRALDPAVVSNGEAAAVEGVLDRDANVCTEKLCEPGVCCNACWAEVVLRGDDDKAALYLDRNNPALACNGNEAGLCCGTELGVGRVRLIGNVRDTPAGRRLDVREACRIDETLLKSKGHTCQKSRGCEVPAKSAGVCTRRKQEVYIGEVLDKPAAYAGKQLHVKGRIGKGPAICTQMACAEGTCCNTCAARMQISDDRGRAIELVAVTPPADGEPDLFVCAGDDSWLCCPSFANDQLGVVSGTIADDGGRLTLLVSAICDL